MDFHRYRINIIVRLSLILVLSMAAFIIILETDYWTISIWILLVAFLLTVSLISFFEKSLRHLYRFVSSIKNFDFSPVIFNDPATEFDIEMNKVYGEISAIFRSLRDDKEFHHQYLQVLIEHLNIAVVCFNDKFEVQFSNKAAFELFGRPYFHNIESFRRINPEISNAIENVRRGNNQLLKIILKNELCSITVSSAEFKFHDREYKLVTFYNIKPELERQELESWKKLIRTITHEVNNSAIPITNLTHYVSQTITNKEGEFFDLGSLEPARKDDLKTSLSTIEKRSDGLVKFINSTRSFTKNQKADFQRINLEDLINRVLRLLEPDIKDAGVRVETEIIPESVSVVVDPSLFEQVIINLILNSIEACTHTRDARISIKAEKIEDQSVKILIADNGSGIKPEDLGNIFVPYFTTKSKGSGLGLSISRNIIDMHKGRISVRSDPGSGTIFSIWI